jgi:hypothetical protein
MWRTEALMMFLSLLWFSQILRRPRCAQSFYLKLVVIEEQPSATTNSGFKVGYGLSLRRDERCFTGLLGRSPTAHPWLRSVDSGLRHVGNLPKPVAKCAWQRHTLADDFNSRCSASEQSQRKASGHPGDRASVLEDLKASDCDWMG